MTGVRPMLPVAMLCAVTLYAAPARAGVHGEITDFGETTAEQEKPATPTPDDHSLIPRTTIAGIRYVDRTSTLPAQLCLRFGVTLRVSADAGERLPDRLIVVVTHPRITRPDQASSTRDSFPTAVVRGMTYAGWTFDRSWEQQPGEWTVTFMNGREVVASKTFTITAPAKDGSRCSTSLVS